VIRCLDAIPVLVGGGLACPRNLGAYSSRVLADFIMGNGVNLLDLGAAMRCLAVFGLGLINPVLLHPIEQGVPGNA